MYQQDVMMEHAYLFKVKVIDLVDRHIEKGVLTENAINILSKFRQYVEGETGGMLCMDHFELPDVNCGIQQGAWVLEVSCCCSEHMETVQQRLLRFLR